MRTYQSSCHCGACRFEDDLDLDAMRSYELFSICKRRAAEVVTGLRDSATHNSPLENLSTYKWGIETADYFCTLRSLAVFRTASPPEERAQGTFDGWAINVRV